MAIEFQRDQPKATEELSSVYRQTLRDLNQASDPAEKLRLLGELGGYARQLRDYPAAIAYYQSAIRLAESLSDSPRVAANTVRLGVALHHSGQFEQGTGQFRRVLAQPDTGYHDFAHQHLGKLLVEQGDYAQARQHFEQALLLRQAKGDRELLDSTNTALQGLSLLESGLDANQEQGLGS